MKNLRFDDALANLIEELSRRLDLSKQEAVRVAVMAELDRLDKATPLSERFAKLRAEFPLPEPTGKLADKAFFDDLCGDL